MSKRFDLRPNDHLGLPALKQSLNLALFSEVAPKYDFVTRALSMGRDASWKRWLIENLPDRSSPCCVDLACGTGDLSRLLGERYSDGHVVAIDLTPAMLEIARERTRATNVEYREGSMGVLPLPDASADILTGGYALRNAPDLSQALDEVSRVLRPGGCAAFLDFSKPGWPPGQVASWMILKFWGGLWGLVLHHNSDVYGYIADSLHHFPDRAELRRRFRDRNFTLLESGRRFGGLLEMLIFEKVEG